MERWATIAALGLVAVGLKKLLMEWTKELAADQAKGKIEGAVAASCEERMGGGLE